MQGKREARAKEGRLGKDLLCGGRKTIEGIATIVYLRRYL